jgi:hypothetical protein
LELVALLVLLSAAYPLARAWRANRRTTLRHALGWAAAAWAAWAAALAAAAASPGAPPAVPYLALCLTGCAGVAVLGARRPGEAAWDFVVAGLLAVLSLPVARGLGNPRPEPAHLGFLGAALAVPLLNYLPTRLGAAALLAGAAAGVELAALAGAAGAERLLPWSRCLLGAAPWSGLALAARRPAGSDFDRAWLAFRDRFGLVWGQRVREQFNRAAANAGRPEELSWSGLRAGAVPAAVGDELLSLLRAVFKRFGLEGQSPGEADKPGGRG